MIYYILKKCPYSEFFWSVFSHFWSIFSCIPSEYEDLQNKLVQMRENRDQKNSDTNTNTFHTVIFSQNFYCNNKMKCSYYKIKYLHTKCSNFDTWNLRISNILNLLIIDYCHDISLRKKYWRCDVTYNQELILPLIRSVTTLM